MRKFNKVEKVIIAMHGYFAGEYMTYDCKKCGVFSQASKKGKLCPGCKKDADEIPNIDELAFLYQSELK